jgi:hypothetical protein
MGPCLVLTDENLRPLRPTILYGIDARAEAQINELNVLLGQDALFATCGKALSSQAVGPKPYPTRAALYDELFAAYESLYPATRDHMHLLAGLQQLNERQSAPR